MISTTASINLLNRAQLKTLNTVFKTPPPLSVEWRKLESLFIAVGAHTIEGSGSRVRFELNGVIATFHRPHPQKEAKPYQIKDAKQFLLKAGVQP